MVSLLYYLKPVGRSDGVVECWSVGVLEWWSDGVMGWWSDGVLEYWSIEKRHQSFSHYSNVN
jgi:hypothetical protein